jgi:PAS domain S-box-containing protein
VISEGQVAGTGRGLAEPRELLCTVDRGGRLTSLNADWQLVLGWTADELTSRPIADFVHPSERPQVATAIDEAMKPGGGVVEVEHRFRAHGGGWRWLRMKIQSDGDSWLGRATDVTDEHEAQDQLRAALTPERLVAHGQPIVESGSGALLQEELLVRMRAPEDPDLVLPPAEFLPRAEQLGLVPLVDRSMVSMGLELATHGRRAAVNISARSIQDPTFIAEVEHAVRYTGRYAANLVFEITETVVLEQLDVAADFAQRLNALGVAFALDDFGTGLGSLTELRSLPIQFLKIDALFVQNAIASPRDRAMVSGIVALARQLGMQTVAEGIEDAGTLKVIGDCGVDYAQGFFLGAPIPIDPHVTVHRPLRKASSVAIQQRPAPRQLTAGQRTTTGLSRRKRRLWALAPAAAVLALCVLALALAGVLSGSGGGTSSSASRAVAGGNAPALPNFQPPGVFGAPLTGHEAH